MFSHRRVRTAVVLMISWVVMTGVERVVEHAPWQSAFLRGLVWAGVVTGAWWFAEWTQVRPVRATVASHNESQPLPADRRQQ
ncbi:hypothetical protein [Streptomyces subrutilus]|uniref:Uncharacterized protein n=1 Tax=Streptomyces subrutilus TaxID=36818 RepID=A0A1E5PLH4_9ACTN|nr:hypothetical protein [Streptomyces subrutilus]OEJ30407.1 hypothetical protein BGK67_02705 [Streptomyces subrutilus]